MMTAEKMREAAAKVADDLAVSFANKHDHKRSAGARSAAAAIRALPVEPDNTAALVAAAYEDAAQTGYLGWDDDDAQEVRAAIRARTPADARAALDRVVAEAVEMEREIVRAAIKAMGGEDEQNS